VARQREDAGCRCDVPDDLVAVSSSLQQEPRGLDGVVKVGRVARTRIPAPSSRSRARLRRPREWERPARTLRNKPCLLGLHAPLGSPGFFERPRLPRRLDQPGAARFLLRAAPCRRAGGEDRPPCSRADAQPPGPTSQGLRRLAAAARVCEHSPPALRSFALAEREAVSAGRGRDCYRDHAANSFARILFHRPPLHLPLARACAAAAPPPPARRQGSLPRTRAPARFAELRLGCPRLAAREPASAKQS